MRNSDKGEFLMETPQQVMYAFYAVLMLAAADIAASQKRVLRLLSARFTSI